MLRLKTQNIQLAPLKMTSRPSTTKASQNTAALKIAALTTGLLWAAVGGACSNNPHDFDMDEDVLIGAIDDDPQTLDPAEAGDSRSVSILANIYGRAYQFSYFGDDVQKYKMIPDLAEEMGTWGEHTGQDSQGVPKPKLKGKPTYTVRIKSGLRYEPDICLDPELKQPATRAIHAEDFAYSIRRQADPSIKTAGSFMVDSIVGFEQYRKILREQMEKNGKADPRTQMPGVEVIDKHSLMLTVEEKSSVVEYLFVTWFASPVPHECVVYYHGEGGREDFRQVSIASGPYKLQEWQFGHSLTLVKNENYHTEIYPDKSVGSPAEKKAGFFKDSGKKLPLIEKLYFRVFAQPVPQWLAFEQGYLDASGIPESTFNQVIFENKLTDRYKERGIRLMVQDDPTVFYIIFNMLDPVVGGYTPDKNKLRQALSLAIPREEFIEIISNGRGKVAHSPIPPGIVGYKEDYKNPWVKSDINKAKALMAEAGYPNGIDPKTNRPLQIKFLYPAGSNPTTARYFQKQFEKLGIKFELVAMEWYALLAKQKKGQFQVSFGGWHADYPDAENFMQLLYSGNAGTQLNPSNYKNPQFDSLYVELKATFDPTRKIQLVTEMNEVLNSNMPWIYLFTRISYGLFPPWLKNYQPHPMAYGFTKYRRINQQQRAEFVTRYNEPQYWVLIMLGLIVAGAVVWARVEKRRME